MPPEPPLKPWLWLGLVLVSAAGVGITGYLTYSYFTGEPVACIGGAGCREVQASRFAFVLGVPMVSLGVGFYLTSFLLSLGAVFWAREWPAWVLPILFVLATAAALFSLYLTGLQLLVIHAFCGWCLASAGLSVSLFVLTVALLWRSPEPDRPAGGPAEGRL